MRISPHAPLFFVYLKHDFLFLLLLLLLVEGEQVIRQAAPAAPVSNAAGSKLLQRVNESKYSAWPPTYQTVRLGQRVVTKKWTYKEVQISNIRSSRQNTQNLKLVDVHFSTVSIWSFQVDIWQPTTTNNICLFLVLLERVGGLGTVEGRQAIKMTNLKRQTKLAVKKWAFKWWRSELGDIDHILPYFFFWKFYD